MASPFTQLFLLPDEIVRYSVLAQLSWNNLSRLDVAANNRTIRQQFDRWTLNSRRKLLLNEKSKVSFLQWIASKRVSISDLHIHEDVGENLLAQIAESKLNVEMVYLVVGKQISSCAAISILSSFYGLRSISMDMNTGFHVDDTWRNLFILQPKLQSIDLYNYRGESGRSTVRFVEFIAENCSDLNHCVLYNVPDVDDHAVLNLVQRCPQLHGLYVVNCAELSDLALQSIAQYCANLTNLYLAAYRGRITDAGLVPLLQRCRKLTSLNLWDCTGVTDHSIVELGAFGTQITALSLPRCGALALSTTVSEEALMRLRKLTTLDLENGTNISEQLLIAVVHNNPNLCRINLSGIETVSNKVVAAIGNACSQELWALTLTHCAQITDITPLCKCLKLWVLQISHCRGVTDDTLLQLAATPGPVRTYVHVFGCVGVTDAVVKTLKGSPWVKLQFMHTD